MPQIKDSVHFNFQIIENKWKAMFNDFIQLACTLKTPTRVVIDRQFKYQRNILCLFVYSYVDDDILTIDLCFLVSYYNFSLPMFLRRTNEYSRI